tara:strand:+ start:41 stop:271 length:231 start_codon:yes stop_codon:yes gene_type:complete
MVVFLTGVLECSHYSYHSDEDDMWEHRDRFVPLLSRLSLVEEVWVSQKLTGEMVAEEYFSQRKKEEEAQLSPVWSY